MGKFFNSLWLKLTLEPAMALEVIKQALNIMVVFNLVKWDAQQFAGVNIFIGMFLQFVVRQAVIPNPRVESIKTEEEIKTFAEILEPK